MVKRQREVEGKWKEGKRGRKERNFFLFLSFSHSRIGKDGGPGRRTSQIVRRTRRTMNRREIERANPLTAFFCLIIVTKVVNTNPKIIQFCTSFAVNGKARLCLVSVAQHCRIVWIRWSLLQVRSDSTPPAVVSSVRVLCLVPQQFWRVEPCVFLDSVFVVKF